MSDDDEQDLFRKQMSDVVRRQFDVVKPEHPRPAPVPHKTREDERAVMSELLAEPDDWANVDTGDELFYYQAGTQRRLVRKMRRGGYAVTAELDLHGYTVEQARQKLAEFLHNLDRSRQSCVRIVHGKGIRSPGRQPVLKNKVAAWLANRRDVLGYCSAPAHDGGLGALYVLLKKR